MALRGCEAWLFTHEVMTFPALMGKRFEKVSSHNQAWAVCVWNRVLRTARLTVVTCEHVLDNHADSLPSVQAGGRSLTVTGVMRPEINVSPDLVLIEIFETDHPVLPLRASKKTTADFYSFGYQFSDRGYNGYSVSGRIGGIAVDAKAGHEPQTLIVLTQANISGGLRAGCLGLSLADDAVVGVVKRSNPDGGGYAIPIESLDLLRPYVIAQNNQITSGLASSAALA